MNPLLKLIRFGAIKTVIVHAVIPVLDVLLSPATLLAAFLMKSLRRVGVYRLPVTHAVLRAVGVFPIRDHYYEPHFHPRHLTRPLDADRTLPGIDMNVAGQLELLERFSYQKELAALPRRATGKAQYCYENPNFGPGDAEYFYSLIRLSRPRTIVEIGSGASTLMALNAIAANRRDEPKYRCRMVCIEPYEMPWLESVPSIEVIRQRVELVELSLFDALDAGDILFIDSSHVVRPQGDVVREYLEILPRLRPGVLVHVHDIFTPRDYPREWVVEQVRLYSEQYLVEAFLAHNRDFRILAMVDFLARHYRERIVAKCPVFGEGDPPGSTGSLWLQRV